MNDFFRYQREQLLILETEFSRHEFLASDPVELPHAYLLESDREFVGFLAAIFAYGNVKAIRGFLRALLGQLSPNPSRAVRDGISVHGLYYRFQNESDIGDFISAIGKLMNRFGGLELAFGADTQSLLNRIRIFQENLYQHLSSVTRGLRHLIGEPGSQSAHKRYCMFLRWMTRSGFPDFALYRTFRPENLIVPLDVHLARMARNLGWTESESSTWKNAERITDSLREIEPSDPLRFDFALTRPGILRLCKSRLLPHCDHCSVRKCCRIYAKRRPKSRGPKD